MPTTGAMLQFHKQSNSHPNFVQLARISKIAQIIHATVRTLLTASGISLTILVEKKNVAFPCPCL